MIDASELKVEAYDPLPPGGQRVGVRTGIKVTHLPTGLVAIVDSDRSQHRNKLVAIDMIEGALTSPHFRG